MPDWDDETCVTEQATAVPARPDDRERAYLIVLAGESVGEMYKLPPSGPAVIGRGRSSNVALHDEGVSRAHCQIVDDADEIFVEDLDSRNGTFVNGERVLGRARLRDGDKIQVGRTTILKFTYHDSLEESFQKQMYESALRDGLTKVYNKRYFTERIVSEMRFAVRHKAMLALLLVDVDHFKKVNDTFGHVAGDKVLVAVAHALARSVRNEDVVARYGGEEFAVVLRATPIAHVRGTAERLRKLIESLTVEHESGPIRVTASVGMATFPELPIRSPEQLIEAADQALYRAKNAGRNRVSE
jgi:two-component system, cell cycle response regulator